MTKFLIIRHGYSKSNENGYFTGQTDVPLATLGIEQAERTAEYLLEIHTIDAIYSSPLQRARETASPIARKFRLPVSIADDLKEINGGAWEEKTPEEILRLYKDDYVLWQTDIGLARCTGGENMQEVQLRALNALREIAKQNDGKTVAVTTHAGVIRALQCAWQRLPLSEMKHIAWVENASVTTVTYDGEFALQRVGDSRHLSTLKTNLPKEI